MNITFKAPSAGRKSISDTIKNIEDMLVSKATHPPQPRFRDSQLREPQSEKSNKPKMKGVIRDCEDMLSSQRKLEKQSFGLNLTSDFFKAYQPKFDYSRSQEVSRPIMMLNQPNVVLNTKDIKSSIEELEMSKTRFERMKQYILENERMLKLQLEKPTALFEDYFILPLNYINNAPNRDQKLTSTMSSSQTGLYQLTFFCVKSQNNFIASEKQVPQIKRGRKVTQGKLVALKVFNAFLRKNNFLGMNIEPRTIKKMILNRNPNIKTYYYGFHEDERFDEGTYYEEEEQKSAEEALDAINANDEDQQEKARLEMEEYAKQIKKKKITEKLERNPRVLEVLILFLKQVYFDAAMPFKFKRKKSLGCDKYEFDLGDSVKNFSKKNRKPVKKERNLDVRKMEEARENKLLSTYKLDFFDFSAYPQQTNLDLMVGPDEERPELGNVTLAAPIYKQIKNTDKVHFRWLVLRGFNLYWYRSADHSCAKGIIPLPTKPIMEVMVNKRSMFKLPEGLGRNLTFELKDSGIVWRRLLANQIAFQFYYDMVDKEKMKVSNNLVKFFETESSTKLDMSELGIKKMSYNESGFESKIEVFFDLLIDALVYHNKLKELNFSKAGVGPGVLQKLIGVLGEGNRNFRLEVMNLEKNAMNFQALVALEKYLVSDNSSELKVLLLNGNDLYDQGVMHLAQTLYNRHMAMLEKKIDKYNLPLQKLGLLNVKMSDQGFFGLITQLEKIHKMNKNKGIIEYVSFLDLNISENLISENSIKGLCRLLEDFGGFSVLELGKCKKIKGYIFKTLMNVVKTNYSILYLNYEENEIDTDGFMTLLDVLEENFVIRKIKFTLPYALYEKMLGSIKQAYQFFQIAE